MMKKVLCVFLFSLLLTGGVSLGDGYKVRKSLVAGEQGMEILVVPLAKCGPEVVCDGAKIIDVKAGAQVELCWKLGTTDVCESGPIAVSDVGIHYFTVTSFVEDKEVTYKRWNPDTQVYEDTTYTMPGSEGLPSNEAVLVVRSPDDLPDPPVSGSCSVKKFIP